MSCIGRTVLEEARIDEVEAKQVVTTNQIVKEVDLYTVRPEELLFETDFKLQAKRDDYIQAFIAYFVVDFSKCHKRIQLSTCE